MGEPETQSRYAFAIVSQPIGIFTISHRHSFGVLIEYKPDGEMVMNPVEYEGALYYNRPEYNVSQQNIDIAMSAEKCEKDAQFTKQQIAELRAKAPPDDPDSIPARNDAIYLEYLVQEEVILDRLYEAHRRVLAMGDDGDEKATAQADLAALQNEYILAKRHVWGRYEGDSIMLMPCSKEQAQFIRDSLDNIWVEHQHIGPKKTPNVMDKEDSLTLTMPGVQPYYFGGRQRVYYKREDEIRGQAPVDFAGEPVANPVYLHPYAMQTKGYDDSNMVDHNPVTPDEHGREAGSKPAMNYDGTPQPLTRPVLVKGYDGQTKVRHEPVLDADGAPIMAEEHSITRVATNCESWVVNVAQQAGLPIPNAIGTMGVSGEAFTSTDMAGMIKRRIKGGVEHGTAEVDMAFAVKAQYSERQVEATVIRSRVRHGAGVLYVTGTDNLMLREVLEHAVEGDGRLIDHLFDTVPMVDAGKHRVPEDYGITQLALAEDGRGLELSEAEQVFLEGMNHLTPEQQEKAASFWPPPDLRQPEKPLEEILEEMVGEAESEPPAEVAPEEMKAIAALVEAVPIDTLRGRMVSDRAFAWAQQVGAGEIHQGVFQQVLHFAPEQGEALTTLAGAIERARKDRPGSVYRISHDEQGRFVLCCREDKLGMFAEAFVRMADILPQVGSIEEAAQQAATDAANGLSL
ncbi:hypothetical protein GC177_09680 [bacterium]|nr:hypothetical protein [bacterium]